MRLTVPLHWHNSINFGDKCAPYLIEKITGRKAGYVFLNGQTENLICIGSLLSSEGIEASTIWGAGFAYEPETVFRPKEIKAVRGPLSRDVYLKNGIDCPGIYGDPAILLPLYYQPKPEKKYKTGLIPHVVDYQKAVDLYTNTFDIIIDLRLDIEMVIDQICSCERTLSSSLHGLVVSHAYGIPSTWAEISDKVIGNGFKFMDYMASFDYSQDPVDMRDHSSAFVYLTPPVSESQLIKMRDGLINVFPIFE